MKICNLQNNIEYLDEVARLEYEEWASDKEINKEARIERKKEKICNMFSDKSFCKLILVDNDELIGVRKTTGDNNIILASSEGRMVIFNEDEIRVMGRTASGVKGINLDSSLCIGLDVADDSNNILIVTKNGYGKKTVLSEYRKTKRGSKGVKALSITEKNGNLIAFKIVDDDQDLMIITDSGIVIRLPIDQISQLGRVTQGVKLINLKDSQSVSAISVVSHYEETTDNSDQEEE